MVRIRADVFVPGHGHMSHEQDYCFLGRHKDGDYCPIGGAACRYGLTEVTVPLTCPLRVGQVKIVIVVIPDAAGSDSRHYATGVPKFTEEEWRQREAAEAKGGD